MAVDSRQQSQMHTMPYDPLRFTHFSNPWVGGPAVSSQMVPSSQPSAGVLDAQSSLQHRLPSLTLPPYTSLTATTTSLAQEPLLAAAYHQHSPLQTATDINGHTYQFVPATSAVYQPAPAPAFIHMPERSGYGYSSDPAMRASNAYANGQDIKRESFDVVDASRGMLSLSQNDITPTPKNMFGAGREAENSYGFPPSAGAHSSHSSISSAGGIDAAGGGGGSGLHSNYGSPVGDYSLTDYSSASESVDGLNHRRTLPRPATMPHHQQHHHHHHPGNGVGVGMPQQSMMGQFSSKVPNGIQKKHKCKVCDKRFTRPSSLQTHIYSHTGEKPFACEVEGCGRHFSVVSNLRRHHRVHRNERSNEESDGGLSPDGKAQYDS